jgi:phosphatidylserine/phosphatidylglycerophosphate/cardiolipin synthase-like enzyme
VKLIVQPDDGVVPIVLAMQRARRTLDVPIFRLDHVEIDRALKAAAKRGVVVRTLVAHTNRGGEKALRKLEQRLLATGATVSRSDDDLLRYHYKIVIVDRAVLYVLGFNFTHEDIDESRSMGLVTRNRRLVAEALRLFEADFDRQPYQAGLASLVVSPQNSRPSLAELLASARRQLAIYDENVTDNGMLRVIEDRARAGVGVRILGHIERPIRGVSVEKFPGTLHLRAIVVDGRRAFIGSQSLRRLELDGRREVGVIFKDARVIGRMMEIFEQDWARTPSGRKQAEVAKQEAELSPARRQRSARPRRSAPRLRAET